LIHNVNGELDESDSSKSTVAHEMNDDPNSSLYVQGVNNKINKKLNGNWV